MVKFIKRNNVIPVDFGEFKFEFQANDDNLKRLSLMSDELKEKAGAIESETDLQAFENMQGFTKDCWDGVFGEGSFDKVYEFSGGSTMIAITYFLEAVDGINEEYNKQVNTDQLAKYLKKAE